MFSGLFLATTAHASDVCWATLITKQESQAMKHLPEIKMQFLHFFYIANCEHKPR